MCYIMTADGWKQLSPSVFSSAEEPKPHNGCPVPYPGRFPSADLCEYVNRRKTEDLKYFDDGIRLVYGKPDRQIKVENEIPIHPIRSFPDGFTIHFHDDDDPKEDDFCAICGIQGGIWTGDPAFHEIHPNRCKV